MMDFLTSGSIASALAPKVEVGQEALYDALRARDETRALRIIKRVSRDARDGAGARGNKQRVPEADLNAPDSRGLRPIHLAAMAGMADCVIALVNAGVPVDAMGAEGNTALHLAVFHKKEGVVAVLMRAGASPSQENIKGKTAVDLAQSETTMTLLCPLHFAAGRGMLDNLVALVAKGVSVNAVGGGGDTPLHAAASTGNTDAVRLLLARGADPLRRNAAGETPLDLARRLGWDRQISSRGGDGVVWVLEGAASEAEAVAAAAAAIEAEKAAARGAAVFHEGESVVYLRDGEEHPAVVMKVHHDDEEPYYTVRVHATGRERQTDANHLVRPSSPQGNGGVDGDSAIGGGATNGKREDMADITGEDEANPVTDVSTSGSTDGRTQTSEENQATIGRTASSPSDEQPGGGNDRKPSKMEERSRAGPSQGDASGAVVCNSRGDWAAARTMFLEVASRLCTAAELRNDDEFAVSGRSLAASFAAVPAEEVDAMLLKRFLERGVPTRKEGKVGVGGGDVRSLSSFSEEEIGAEADGKRCDSSASDENLREAVAHALADACRDIVLKGLLGSETAVKWRNRGENGV